MAPSADELLIERDILAYLAEHEAKELLRFVIVGSVDDGKSTLIGRLLFELGAVYDDQLASVRAASKHAGLPLDLSLITDGLEAEREQGITIDVAYRYFTTASRKFIVADTPGHVQYTRNMVTGASTADVGVILVDARLGVLEQSRRHAYLASLLGIPHLLVAVNKMDLVGWERSRFETIAGELREALSRMGFKDVTVVPVSALLGDNVVQESARTPWYSGPTVLRFLETVPIAADRNLADLRYPVQLALRPTLAYRGFAGQLASGVVRRGDPVMVLPSGKTSRVKAIDTYDGECDEAFAPQSVTLRLEDEIDCSRGDMIVHPGSLPRIGTTFEASLVWMHERELDLRKSYLLKHTTRTVRMQVDAVLGRVDLSTLASVPAETLGLNDVGQVRITCHRPILHDPYAKNRVTGSFIVVDSLTNATVGAGMIAAGDLPQNAGQAHTRVATHTQVSPRERRDRLGQTGLVVWVDGAEGTLELAYALERRLYDLGHAAHVLAPSAEPAAAIALACRTLAEAGLVTVCVSHDTAARAAVREAVGVEAFLDVRLGAEVRAGTPDAEVARVLADDLDRGLERIVRLVGELGGFERV
jgi:sulfate adenylyltransferase large subunit